jgi:hypothetical protein
MRQLPRLCRALRGFLFRPRLQRLQHGHRLPTVAPTLSIFVVSILMHECYRRYRARDLTNVSTLLYCQTEPVIESSKDVSFGCFSFAYLPLASQFVAAKLSPWDNRWSEVYDFTPNSNGTKNFSLLDPALEDSFPVKPLTAVGEWAWYARLPCARVMCSCCLAPRLHMSCDTPFLAGARRLPRSSLHVRWFQFLSGSALCLRAAIRQVCNTLTAQRTRRLLYSMFCIR